MRLYLKFEYANCKAKKDTIENTKYHNANFQSRQTIFLLHQRNMKLAKDLTLHHQKPSLSLHFLSKI